MLCRSVNNCKDKDWKYVLTGLLNVSISMEHGNYMYKKSSMFENMNVQEE